MSNVWRKMQHTNKGNKIIFKDIDKLKKIFDSYSTENRPTIRSSIRNPKVKVVKAVKTLEGEEINLLKMVENSNQTMSITSSSD